MASPHLELTGFCHIFQGSTHLTGYQGNAVTTLVSNSTWCITSVDGQPLLDSHPVTIALTTGPLADSNAVPNVLTLGKTTQEGTQIYVSSLKYLPLKEQMWTLEDMISTKRFPPLVNARIQSWENPGMSAAVGGLETVLPKLYRNVSAVNNDAEGVNNRWNIDCFRL